MGKLKGESRGFVYFKQVRFEVVHYLFKFFGEFGSYFEFWMCFLILIVIKVINFLLRGLQQYVFRVLKEGATVDEIIDVVLCFYFCVGLIRVVDVFDVIFDMGFFGFEISGEQVEFLVEEVPVEEVPVEEVQVEEAQVDFVGEEWREIGRCEDFSKDGCLEVNLGDRCLVVFDIDGEVLVIDGFCFYRSGSLSRGQLEGKVVICSFYHWQFDLQIGVLQDNSGVKVGIYEVKVEDDGRIFVWF